jgi:hypothetical protein
MLSHVATDRAAQGTAQGRGDARALLSRAPNSASGEDGKVASAPHGRPHVADGGESGANRPQHRRGAALDTGERG